MKKIHGNQICKVCSKNFITIDDLLAHMDKIHKDLPKTTEKVDLSKERAIFKVAVLK